MKQFLAAVMVGALFCAAFLGTGCDRSSGKSDSQASESEPDSVPQVADQTEFTQRGFAAIQDAPIYQLSFGRPIWINSLDFGEALEFDISEVSGNTLPGKLISYKLQSTALDDRTVYLIPVRFNGRQGWIDASHYAPENYRVGVVVELFELQYRQEEMVFRRGNLLVASKSNELYAPVYGLKVNDPVKAEQISFDSDDVETAKLLTKAKAARSGERAQELLREAAEKYPNSVLSPLIDEMLKPEDRGTETLVALFSTVSEETLVYVKPDLLSSAVVAHLEPYTDVRTIERIIKQETTRDGSSRWYHISEPVNGWVFGLNLEGAD